MQSRSHSREPHAPVKLSKNDVSRRAPPRTLDESIHDDRIFVKVRPLIVGESGEDRGLFFLSPTTFVLATDLIANAVIVQHVVDMTAALRRLDQNGEDLSLHSIAVLPPSLRHHIKRFGDDVIDLSKIPEPLEKQVALPIRVLLQGPPGEAAQPADQSRTISLS